MPGHVDKIGRKSIKYHGADNFTSFCGQFDLKSLSENRFVVSAVKKTADTFFLYIHTKERMK